MCYKIDSSFILIHVLKNNKCFSIKELVSKKRLIEEQEPTVFVDLSKDSILRVVESYPEIFDFSDNKISKKENTDKYFSTPLIDFFSFDLEANLKTKITNIIESI